MRDGLVSVAIVTFNSARYIRKCLEFVFSQDHRPLEIVVIDNASSDATPDILRNFEGRIRTVYNLENKGFAGGQNQAIGHCQGEWILVLNPDVRLQPDFVSTLVAAGKETASVGTLCGKLLSMSDDFQVPEKPLIDSTGMFFTPNLRHFDRGSREPDEGQFNSSEYVFGATGAAALYRREMIEDVSIRGELFDSEFFAYREDADLAWRAQLLGWQCLYVPEAVAYHVRHVLPTNRQSVSPVINMHSVKNRFLMRINNLSGRQYLRHFLAITGRDLVVIGGCLIRERSSLRAFPNVLKNLRRALAMRRAIRARRRVTEKYMSRWFSSRPVSFPALGEIPARPSKERTRRSY
ncbi:MAG: glycosyltransferase family 2 protein [Bryobacteraceae bacterium]